jgi:hypothetical protein
MLRTLIDALDRRSRSVRTTVIAIILFSIMVTNLRHFSGILQIVQPPSADEVVQSEQRLQALKAALPERGVVGFLTDATRRYEREKRQRLARYVLAPLLVVDSIEWPLVIGDFSDPDTARRALPRGLEVRRDFGDGLLLLARDP